MKKFISILFLFVLSLFVMNGQSKVTYVDSLKSVTVNVSTDAKKQLDSNNTLQTQIARSVDSQLAVNATISSMADSLASGINYLTKEIEERNKNDGLLLTDKFNYTPQQVKKAISTDRWLNLFTILLCIMYIMYVNRELNYRDTRDNIVTKALLYVGIGIITFYVLQSLLTLLFNKDYFIINSLMSLYT